MKIALAQLNFHVGNIAYNTNKIIETISNCKNSGVDLLVFPELSVCGYPPRDLLTYSYFVSECLAAINKIAEYTAEIGVIVGSPSFNLLSNGKSLCNSAFFLYNQKIQARINKTLLPTYDVFDEYRYFEPNKHFELVEFKNRTFALTICEDLWNVLPKSLYNVLPMDELSKKNPDFAINIAASPFSYNHHSTRKFVLKQNAERYKIPFFYVNQVGASTDLIFDGGSMVIDAYANTVITLPFFEERVDIIELSLANDDAKTFEIKANNHYRHNFKSVKEERIYNALILGIKDYFKKLNFKKCLLGLSGGVDSALVTVLATQALGNENVLPVLMPSSFSSEHSITDSIQLCKNLQLTPLTLNIHDIYTSFLQTLSPVFNQLPFNIAEENIQSRTRGTLLMAISNKLGYVLLNTSNKSELAVGYGTLYGDMCGALSVIGDLYKTEVYELCNWINKTFNNIIPENILLKEPSAELRPNQKDSDSLPDYELLDRVLDYYINQQLSAQEIIKKGYDSLTVKKIIEMVNRNEYKRYQAPPVLRVSDKAFGSGRRMPLEGYYP